MAAGKNDRVGFGSRAPQRGGSILVAVLVVVAILVLLVSLIQGLTTTPRELQISQQVYLDSVVPLVDRSNAAGKDLNDIRNTVLPPGTAQGDQRTALGRAVDRLNDENEAILRDVQALNVPKETTTAHALLVGSMAHRRAALSRFRGSIDRATNPDVPASSAAEGLTEVGRDLVAGDRSYLLFREMLVNPERPTPDSKWVLNENDWRPGVLQYWVDSLRNRQGTQPVHDVAVVANAVITDPPDLRIEGQDPEPMRAVIPPAKTMSVQAIMINKGNSAQSKVPVEASLVASNGQVIDKVADSIDLAAGQTRTVVFKLRPPPVNTPFKLSVKIGPVQGDPTPEDGEFTREYIVR